MVENYLLALAHGALCALSRLFQLGYIFLKSVQLRGSLPSQLLRLVLNQVCTAVSNVCS